MGAAPRLALVSMALPAVLPLSDFDGSWTGLRRSPHAPVCRGCGPI